MSVLSACASTVSDEAPSSESSGQGANPEDGGGFSFVFFRKTLTDQTLVENEPFYFDVTPYFTGRGRIRYEVLNLPSELDFSPDTRAISGTVTRDDQLGRRQVTVVAEAEGHQHEVTQLFDLVVQNVNDPPTRSAHPLTPVSQAWSVPLHLHLDHGPTPLFLDQDPEDRLFYTIEGLPPDFVVLSQAEGAVLTGMLSERAWHTLITASRLQTFAGPRDPQGGQGDPSQNGAPFLAFQVTLTARDTEGEVVSSQFSLRLTENHRPVRAAETLLLERLAVRENEDIAIDLSSQFTDPDEGDKLVITAMGLPEGLAVRENRLIGKIAEATEIHSIWLTASDGGGAFVRHAFKLAVVPNNRPPQLRDEVTTTLAIPEDTNFTLNLDAYFIDPDLWDAITYALADVPFSLSEIVHVNNKNLVISLENKEVEEETYTIHLQVTDRESLTLTEALVFQLTHVSKAPFRISAPEAPLSATEDIWVTVDLSDHFADPDPGAVLSYTLGFSDRLEEARLVSSSLLVGIFNDDAAAARRQNVTLTVTDGTTTLSDQVLIFEVTKIEQKPEVAFTLADQVFLENENIRLDLSGIFVDPDASDTFVLTSNVLPSGLKIVDETLVGSVRDDAFVDIDHTVALTATDQVGLQGFFSFELRITNVNDAPELIQDLPDVSSSQEHFVLDLADYFRDQDLSDSLTYAVRVEAAPGTGPKPGGGGGPPPAADFETVLNPAGSLSLTRKTAQFGAVTVYVTASDGTESVSDHFEYHYKGLAVGFLVSLGLGAQGVRSAAGVTSDIAVSSPVGLGDTDGDGLSDLAFGTAGSLDPASASGLAAVVYSGATLPASVEALTPAEGYYLQAAAGASLTVLPVGDFNGDGFVDLAVSVSRQEETGVRFSDEAYLIYGQAARTRTTLSLEALAPEDGFVLKNTIAVAGGVQAVSAGDLNKDGFQDLLFEVRGDIGDRYILVEGGRAPVGQRVATDLEPLHTGDELSFRRLLYTDQLHTGDLFRVFLEGMWSSHAGFVGDLNGNYSDDLAFYVSRPRTTKGAVPPNEMSLFLVDDSQLKTAPNGLVKRGHHFANLGLDEAQGEVGPLKPIGDIDGSGMADFAVALAGMHAGESSGTPGEVWVFYDTFGLTKNKKIRTDGPLPDGFRILEGTEDRVIGHELAALDLNGDGLNELVFRVSGSNPDTGAPEPARVYILYGTRTRRTEDLVLTSLRPDEGFFIQGNDGDFGTSLSASGDLNGDGFEDLLIGGGSGGSAGGPGYIVYGGPHWRAAGAGATPVVGETLTATSGMLNLFGTAGSDELTGLAAGGFYYGGSGADRLSFSDPPRNLRFFEAGGGDDTLVLSSLTLDLTDFRWTKRLRSVETLDLEDATVLLDSHTIRTLTEQRLRGETVLHVQNSGELHFVGPERWESDPATSSWTHDNVRVTTSGTIDVYDWRTRPDFTLDLTGVVRSEDGFEIAFSSVTDGYRFDSTTFFGGLTGGVDFQGDGQPDSVAGLFLSRVSLRGSNALSPGLVDSLVFSESIDRQASEGFTILDGRVTLSDGEVRFPGQFFSSTESLSDGRPATVSAEGELNPRWTPVWETVPFYQYLAASFSQSARQSVIGQLLAVPDMNGFDPASYYWGGDPAGIQTLYTNDGATNYARRAPAYAITSGEVTVADARQAWPDGTISVDAVDFEGEPLIQLKDTPSGLDFPTTFRVTTGTRTPGLPAELEATLAVLNGTLDLKDGGTTFASGQELGSGDLERMKKAGLVFTKHGPREVEVYDPVENTVPLLLGYSKLVVTRGSFSYFESSGGPRDYISPGQVILVPPSAEQGEPSFSVATITDEGIVQDGTGQSLAEAESLTGLRSVADGTYGSNGFKDSVLDSVVVREGLQRFGSHLGRYETSSARVEPTTLESWEPNLAKTFLSPAPGTPGATLRLGRELDVARDFNGDGLPDLLAGGHSFVPNHVSAFATSGKVWLLHGGEHPPGGPPATVFRVPEGTTVTAADNQYFDPGARIDNRVLMENGHSIEVLEDEDLGVGFFNTLQDKVITYRARFVENLRQKFTLSDGTTLVEGELLPIHNFQEEGVYAGASADYDTPSGLRQVTGHLLKRGSGNFISNLEHYYVLNSLLGSRELLLAEQSLELKLVPGSVFEESWISNPFSLSESADNAQRASLFLHEGGEKRQIAGLERVYRLEGLGMHNPVVHPETGAKTYPGDLLSALSADQAIYNFRASARDSFSILGTSLSDGTIDQLGLVTPLWKVNFLYASYPGETFELRYTPSLKVGQIVKNFQHYPLLDGMIAYFESGRGREFWSFPDVPNGRGSRMIGSVASLHIVKSGMVELEDGRVLGPGDFISERDILDGGERPVINVRGVLRNDPDAAWVTTWVPLEKETVPKSSDLAQLEADYGTEFSYDYASRPITHLGFEQKVLGDINGDGLDDIGLTALDGKLFEERIFVVFGSETLGQPAGNGGGGGQASMPANFNLHTLSPTEGLQIIPPDFIRPRDEVYSSFFVEPAGDVNGDGLEDFLISSVQHYEYPLRPGHDIVWLIYGSRDALGERFYEIETLPDTGTGTVSYDIGSAGSVRPRGTATHASTWGGSGENLDLGDRFHADVTLYNRDGLRLTLEGTELQTPDSTVEATVRERQVLELARFSKEQGVLVKQNQPVLHVGAGFDGHRTNAVVDLGSAGDVNGDGFDDIFVQFQGSGVHENKLRVVFGSPDGIGTVEETVIISGAIPVEGTRAHPRHLHTGAYWKETLFDVRPWAAFTSDGLAVTANDDGRTLAELEVQSILHLNQMTYAQGFGIQDDKSPRDDHLEQGRLVAIGDINGDSFDDLAYQPFAFSNIIPNSKHTETYVLYGMTDGFGTRLTPSGAKLDPGADPATAHEEVLKLSELEQHQGFVVHTQPSKKPDVAPAGDINGDDLADFQIFSNPRKLDVVWGMLEYRPGGQLENFTGVEPVNLTSGAPVLRGDALSDRLIGDPGVQALLGGGGDDVLGVSDDGFVRAAGGLGTDTLLVRTGVTLDLDEDFAKVRSIEALTLEADSDVQLSVRGLYRMTELRHQSSELAEVFELDLGDGVASEAGELWFYVSGSGRLRLLEGVNTKTENDTTRWTHTQDAAPTLDLYRLENAVLLVTDGLEVL